MGVGLSAFRACVIASALSFPLALANAAQAAPITLEFQGALTNVHPLLASLGAVGNAISGSVTYDTGVPDSSPAANEAFHRGAVLAFSFSLNGNTWTGTQDQDSNILTIRNDWQSSPDSTMTDQIILSDIVAGVSVGEYDPNVLRLFFVDALPSDALASADIPLSIDPTAFLSQQHSLLFLNDAGVGGELRFTLASMTIPGVVAVSEPGSLALLCACVAALGLVRRRSLTS